MKYSVTVKVKDLETQVESTMTFELRAEDLDVVIPIGEFIRSGIIFAQSTEGRPV